MGLDILVFLGTVRDSTPPKPARLGQRVAKACVVHLEEAHNVTLIDPLELDLSTPFKPHFAYAHGKAPDELEKLAKQIEAADAYVMVSPEYNHAMSPALADLLNHFGASLFAFKPSAIVTYSAGQWGGTRAAVNMRTFLSELGCLPVSAMVHLPKAQEALDENGTFTQEPENWASYLERTFSQLAWWAEAAGRQRSEGKTQQTEGFKKEPAQLNAPTS